MGKAGTALVRAIVSAEQGCVERVLGGKLPPGTVCTDVGASTAAITDPATLAKVAKAVAKARAAAAKACEGLPITTSAPAGLGLAAACPSTDTQCAVALTDTASLLDCLECTHTSAAHGLVALPYATTSPLLSSPDMAVGRTP